jgi:hypothetical protein
MSERCKQREITTISYFRISWYPVFSNIVKVDQVNVSDCTGCQKNSGFTFG